MELLRRKRPSAFIHFLRDTQMSLTIPADFKLVITWFSDDVDDSFEERMKPAKSDELSRSERMTLWRSPVTSGAQKVQIRDR